MGGDLHAPKGTRSRLSIVDRRSSAVERARGGREKERRDGSKRSTPHGAVRAAAEKESSSSSIRPSSRPVVQSFIHSSLTSLIPSVRRRPAEIWSPAGGFFADPKNWRRNTVVAAVGIATVAAFIFKKSTSIEERHALPNHAIPSQRFAPQSFPSASS